MPDSQADHQSGPPSAAPARSVPAERVAGLLAVGVVVLTALAAAVAFTGRLWPALPALAVAPLLARIPPARAPRPRTVTIVTVAVIGAGIAVAALRGDFDDTVGAAAWLVTLLLITEATVAGQTQASHLRARVRAEQQARAAMAVRDALTDVANRGGLDMIAGPMIEHARRKGEAVHALYLDLDDFAAVNETLGASAGDELLVSFASALVSTTRSTDVVGRWAGDEFVVIGPGVGSSPLEMERRLKARMETDPPVPPQVWRPRVSIGSATLVPWDDGDLESLLQRAEQDMQLRRSLRRQQSLPRRAGGDAGEAFLGGAAEGGRSSAPGFEGLRGGDTRPFERRRPGRDGGPAEPPALT